MAEKENNKGIRYQDKDLYFGIQMYLINNSEGPVAYDLVGVMLRSGHIKYELAKPGEFPFEVYDWQATLVKPLDLPTKNEDEE